MSRSTLFRTFLRSAILAAACLAPPSVRAGAPAESPALPAASPTPTPATVGPSPTRALKAPILVVTQTLAREVDPRAPAWGYIREVLGRAGLFFEELPSDHLPWLAERPQAIVLLAGNLRLDADQREILARWVDGGGWLIGIGGTSGLDAVFGVGDVRRLSEGWIKLTADDHPVTSGLRSSLHVFGGCVVKPAGATAVAELETVNRAAQGSAILERRAGAGRAILLAPDLLFSIVHIQQGSPVFQDRIAAPDGSAATDDGILKAEDGMALDWQRDRTPMQPDGVPAFLEPITDELRELILRSVLYAASQRGVALPLLWYWPRRLPAIGMISHDTDGNDPARAQALLEAMNRCQTKSTWCVLYPGGYPAEFYRTLRQQGYEIALHFDAKEARATTCWSFESLRFQHRWLLDEAGLDQLTSNKNHYTRWEDRLDFWRWCERVGIRCDQTRGPSKQGTIGFALGGSQPYFPLDDEADPPRMLAVFEMNMLTQDLAVVCPPEYGRQLLDSAARHHGVAHFLFHPAHILKPPVAPALSDLIEYGRSQGLEWWTCDQIYRWEMLRRGVVAKFDSAHALTLATAAPLRDATLLILKTGPRSPTPRIRGAVAETEPMRVYGFDFQAVTVDLTETTSIQIDAAAD